jgi:hypothetical protein
MTHPRYVFFLIRPFDAHQPASPPPRHDDGVPQWRFAMTQARPRAVDRRASLGQHEFVALWSTAMWLLALVYLLATFRVY